MPKGADATKKRPQNKYAPIYKICTVPPYELQGSPIKSDSKSRYLGVLFERLAGKLIRKASNNSLRSKEFVEKDLPKACDWIPALPSRESIRGTSRVAAESDVVENTRVRV